MQVLGKFHALSFALRVSLKIRIASVEIDVTKNIFFSLMKDQEPEKFETLKSMKDVFTQRKDDKVIVDYMNSLVDRAKTTLNKDTDADLIEKFTATFQGNLMHTMLQLVDGNLSEPNAVVCHGDCWNNNLLFKYDVSISY